VEAVLATLQSVALLARLQVMMLKAGSAHHGLPQRLQSSSASRVTAGTLDF
jgi:hypothetical protein